MRLMLAVSPLTTLPTLEHQRPETRDPDVTRLERREFDATTEWLRAERLYRAVLTAGCERSHEAEHGHRVELLRAETMVARRYARVLRLRLAVEELRERNRRGVVSS